MRRRLLTLALWSGLLFCTAAPVLFGKPVESEEQQASESGEAHKWKVINFAIFVAAMGYLLYRTAPRFFNARSADIQKAIKDATGLKLEADFRYSEIDRKMASLAEEIKRMRAESAAEMEREHRRVRHDTELEITRIQNNVAAEIEAFRARGIRTVRQRTANAALLRAEQHLRDRLSGGETDDLVHDFVDLVARGEKK
ncbi:MAG: ATP synthase F0 subunit B [Acidobacteriaceae bacterium]|nr:ATP synthase F0 subunit B [Acidobacteriaceae bacterium]